MKNIFKQIMSWVKALLKRESTMSDNIPENKIRELSQNIARVNRTGLQLSKTIPEPYLSNINILSNLLMAMQQVKENFPHIIEEIDLQRPFDASIRDLKIGLNGFDRILATKIQKQLSHAVLPLDIDGMEIILMTAVNKLNDIGRIERNWLTDCSKYCDTVLVILQKCASVNEEEGTFISWLVEQSLRGN